MALIFKFSHFGLHYNDMIRCVKTNLDCEDSVLLVGVYANFQGVLVLAGSACLLRRQSLVAKLLQSIAGV
jgi:hypothetical protein